MRSTPTRLPAGVPAPWPQRWLARHRRGMDLLVVGLVLAYNQLALPLAASGSRSDLWTLQAASVCLCLAYPLRRRHPLAVFAVMVLAACVQPLISPHAAFLPADLMLLLIVRHLAATSRWTTSLPCAVVVIAWVPLACAPMIRTGEARLSLPGLLIVAVAWAWTWGVLARTRKNYVAALTESAEHSLREQEARHRADALDERARIAREIHDIVSHSLGVMVVVADGAATTAPTDPQRAAGAMIRVRDTGREAMGEMRRMLSLLRTGEPTGVAPQPGTAQLEDLVAEARSTGLPVSLSVTGSATGPLDPSAGLGLTVYRLVQEALTNARRHGGTVSRVDVRVHRAQDRLEVEVLDDGDGPSTPADSSEPSPGSPGHGLVGMRERVASHGGTLETGPRADGGFRVRAVLPIRNGEP
ncbi:sensor histidine kinase [Actinomyces massiliensis]|uniref:sensor histidine kinase n=1 Tax=Actinomyces massiliensis TaxID=461393 RepID=UPI0002E2C613|nr:sensor histidine kinase [Actinomyces massiliensis]